MEIPWLGHWQRYTHKQLEQNACFELLLHFALLGVTLLGMKLKNFMRNLSEQ